MVRHDYSSFAILLFRGDIRRNNFYVAMKVREQGSGLFYAFRQSMVIPGSQIGPGVDFLLEQRNQRMKNYVIGSGIPTSDQWEAASSSMQCLDQVKLIFIYRSYLIPFQHVPSVHRQIDKRPKLGLQALYLLFWLQPFSIYVVTQNVLTFLEIF